MEDEEIDDFVTPYGCSTFVRDEEMVLKKKTQHTCTECQESFVSRPELVTHMEACVTEAFDHEVHSVQNEIRTTFPESGQFPQNVTQGREKAVALFTTHMFQRKRQFSMPGSDFNLTMVPHEIRLTKPGIKMHRIQGGEQREEEADVMKEHTQPLIEQEHEPRRKKMKRPVVDDTLYTFPYPAPFPYPDKPEVVVKATMRVKCPDCFRELLPKNFKEHYRIHTGEMPYPCYFCDKRFRLTHAKMHDCKTPCECHDCDFRCVLPITMDKHRKEEHGDDGSGIEIVSDSAHHNVVVRPPPKPTRRPEFPMTAEQQEADTAANSISTEPEAPIRHLQDYDYDFDDLFGDIPEGPVGELPLPQEPFNFNLKNNNNNDIFIEENDIYIEDDDQIVPY